MTPIKVANLLAAACLSLSTAALATPMADLAAAPALPGLSVPLSTPDALIFARRGRGADDAAGHIRRGRGRDDAAGHAALQAPTLDDGIFARRGRGKDDPVGHG